MNENLYSFLLMACWENTVLPAEKTQCCAWPDGDRFKNSRRVRGAVVNVHLPCQRHHVCELSEMPPFNRIFICHSSSPVTLSPIFPECTPHILLLPRYSCLCLPAQNPRWDKSPAVQDYSGVPGRRHSLNSACRMEIWVFWTACVREYSPAEDLDRTSTILSL